MAPYLLLRSRYPASPGRPPPRHRRQAPGVAPSLAGFDAHEISPRHRGQVRQQDEAPTVDVTSPNRCLALFVRPADRRRRRASSRGRRTARRRATGSSPSRQAAAALDKGLRRRGGGVYTPALGHSRCLPPPPGAAAWANPCSHGSLDGPFSEIHVKTRFHRTVSENDNPGSPAPAAPSEPVPPPAPAAAPGEPRPPSGDTGWLDMEHIRSNDPKLWRQELIRRSGDGD